MWIDHIQVLSYFFRRTYHHVSATKLYLHFGCFAGDIVLSSKFFSFFIDFSFLISFTKIELFWLQTWTKSWIVCFTFMFSNRQKTQFCPKMQIRLCCIHMMIHFLSRAPNHPRRGPYISRWISWFTKVLFLLAHIYPKYNIWSWHI